MPSYKHEHKTKNKWYCSFYYVDYQGKRQRKKKEGFATKREADEFEREFLASVEFSPEMPFKALYEHYIEDMSHRNREHTISNTTYVMNDKIVPFFSDIPIKDITPLLVRKWQNELIAYNNPKTDKPYSQTYLKSINTMLSKIMNYAVKYYNLKENPVHKAGSIGKMNADEMNIWTLDEFNLFIEQVKDKPLSHFGFNIFFWTGIRMGELLALTWNDIDTDNKILHITKSFQRIDGKDVITDPKSPKSIRDIPLTETVVNEAIEVKKQIYKPKNTDRIFPYTKRFFHHEMERGSKKAEIEKIRIHDLRHSHASMLIHLGVNPVAIAQRLGHDKVETTLNTYSHLYPKDDTKIVELLEEFERK